MNEDQWNAFKQYESQTRQSRTNKAQRISEEQKRKENDSAQQHAIREQARRETEQRLIEQKRLAERLAKEKARREEETLKDLLAESAEALRIANERNHEAQIKAREIQQLRQPVKSGASPIETSFYAEWNATHPDTELKPQYSIGRFRVDFAHPETMVAIELDGHGTHSSRKDRTRDYQRQRQIEDLGWSFIRFTGSEIFGDVESCVAIAWKRIQERKAR